MSLDMFRHEFEERQQILNILREIANKDNTVILMHSREFHRWLQHTRSSIISHLNDTQDLVAYVPLQDGTQIKVNGIQSVDPNLITVDGTNEDGEHTFAVLFQSSFQIILRIVEKEPEQGRQDFTSRESINPAFRLPDSFPP